MTEPNQTPVFAPVSVPGIITEGHIELVSGHRAHRVRQIVGAFVGSIGAIMLGAGIAPKVAQPAVIPPTAMQAVSDLCVKDPKECGILSLSSKDIGSALTIFGSLLLLVQFVLVLLPEISSFLRRFSPTHKPSRPAST